MRVEDSLDFIRKKLGEYDDGKVVAIGSFGKDSIALTHLVIQVKPDLSIVWIKTPFLPKETIEFQKRVTKMWGLNLVTVESEHANDEEFMREVVLKPNLPKTNPELCCQIFKVEPTMRYVNEKDVDAWFSGLRRTESEKRGKYTRVWKQGPFTKLHPILDWTEADVWRYTASHHLPVHPWYGEGYRSIGCEPCSNPSKPGEAERGGRWRDTLMEGGGCGIHTTPMK